MRRVRQLMGMPITIDIPGLSDEQLFTSSFGRLAEIDKRFSTYKKNSEVSRFARGELAATDLSGELSEVLKSCQRWQKLTNGYFSAWASGKFDPSGYVKGWAIAEAGKLIERHGYGTYCIGAGGDILCRSDSDKVWNIGIQDPLNKSKILNKLSISNGAVATSGSYERGEHIIDPKTKRPARHYSSVTITGPDIAVADVLATACYAAGKRAVGIIGLHKGYKLLTVAREVI